METYNKNVKGLRRVTSCKRLNQTQQLTAKEIKAGPVNTTALNSKSPLRKTHGTIKWLTSPRSERKPMLFTPRLSKANHTLYLNKSPRGSPLNISRYHENTYIYSHSPILTKDEIVERSYPAKARFYFLGDKQMQGFILADELKLLVQKTSNLIVLLSRGFKLRVTQVIQQLPTVTKKAVIKEIKDLSGLFQEITAEIKQLTSSPNNTLHHTDEESKVETVKRTNFAECVEKLTDAFGAMRQCAEHYIYAKRQAPTAYIQAKALLAKIERGRYLANLIENQYKVHEQSLEETFVEETVTHNEKPRKKSVFARLSSQKQDEKRSSRQKVQNFIKKFMNKIIPQTPEEHHYKRHDNPYEEMTLLGNSIDILRHLDFTGEKNLNPGMFLKKLKGYHEAISLKLMSDKKSRSNLLGV